MRGLIPTYQRGGRGGGGVELWVGGVSARADDRVHPQGEGDAREHGVHGYDVIGSAGRCTLLVAFKSKPRLSNADRASGEWQAWKSVLPVSLSRAPLRVATSWSDSDPPASNAVTT